MNVLLLGSNSSSRKQLLQDMQIPFQLIDHQSDEQLCDWNKPVEELVASIALAKMESIIIPDVFKQQKRCFVLTADTLGCDKTGAVHGKPTDLNDARRMIKALRGKGKVATAFCLDAKKWNGTEWVTQHRITKTVTAFYEFEISDEWIEKYLESVPHVLSLSGALTIDGYGAQFLKSINGSYSTIIGLPVFELRQALEEIGFWQ